MKMAEENSPLNMTSRPVEWTWYPFSWTYFEALHLVSALVGIVGNFLVIHVLSTRRATANRPTDTLIGALAVADFLTSIFIIPLPSAATIPTTHLGELYCKMTLPGFFLFVSFTASIYILTAISIERFLSITYPLRFSRVIARRRLLAVTIYVGSSLHKSIILLTTVNSCVNPVIYIVWFREFRVALKEMFSCQKQDVTSPVFDNVQESTSTTQQSESCNI